VLVFYTPATRDAAGGDAAIQLEIQHAVDFTNFAFANSRITARLRLAAARPIEYAETTPNGADDLLFLHGSPAVAAQREELRADLVGIVKSRWNGISGGAVSMTPTMKGAAISPMAFFQTNLEHMPGNFAHEVGHNFGLQHERGEPDPTPGPLPYGYAYALDPLLRTIMVSGSNPCQCPKIPHYSNPKVRYGGVPTGIPNDRDNARALRVMAPVVATFGSLRGRVVARAKTVAVAEGAAEVVVDLYRVDGSIGPAAVGYSTRSATAKAGQDFVATSGVLEWASGAADVLGLAEYGLAQGRRIVVPLLDDGVRERRESFWIDLRVPRNGARLAVRRLEVTVADDD
jgi:hypothetical protein